MILAAADRPGHRRGQLVTPFSASMGGGGVPGRTECSGEDRVFRGGGGTLGRMGHPGEDKAFWEAGGVLRRRGRPGEDRVFGGAEGIPGRRGHPREQSHPLPGPCHQLRLGNPADRPGTVEGVWEWGHKGVCGCAGCRSVCTCVWVCARLHVCRCGLWPCVLHVWIWICVCVRVSVGAGLSMCM